MTVATREEAKELVAKLDKETLEAIAIIVETAETQGSWVGPSLNDDSGDSVYEDDIAATLNALGNEFRRLFKKAKKLNPYHLGFDTAFSGKLPMNPFPKGTTWFVDYLAGYRNGIKAFRERIKNERQ